MHSPMCSGVSERANKGVSAAERASEASRAGHSKQTSERCERKGEWPSTYIWILDYSGP